MLADVAPWLGAAWWLSALRRLPLLPPHASRRSFCRLARHMSSSSPSLSPQPRASAIRGANGTNAAAGVDGPCSECSECTDCAAADDDSWCGHMNELRVLYSLRSVMGVRFGS